MSLDLDPNHIFRDFVTDGLPASGKHDPRKVEIRNYLSSVSQAVIALVAQADPALTLPNLLIRYSVTGGTANAIEASPNLVPPAGPGLALFSIQIVDDNSGPVTINGKPLRTNSGNEIAPGGLLTGSIHLFLDEGAVFRLVSDQASASIVAAAEVAKVAAQAAQAAAESAAGANLANMDSVAVLRDTHVPPSVTYVRTAGFSTPGDEGGALYKRSTLLPAHVGKEQSADGAWWEIAEHRLLLKQLGAQEGEDVTRILQGAVGFGKNLVVDGIYLVTDKIEHSGGLNIRGLNDAAELHWPADATDGGIEVTPQSWYDYVEVKRVRLTTAAVALWNAVAVNWYHLGATGIPYFWVRCRILSNRIMGALTPSSANDTGRGWLNGIQLDFPFSVEVMDNYIFGAWDGTYQANGINAFKTHAGIYVPDQSQRTLAYLRMERNSIFYTKYGVRQFNIEGTWFVNNDIQVAWRGLHYQNTITPVNQHRIFGNHIGTYETQILVTNARQVLIEHNEISYSWGRTDSASVSLIILNGVYSGSIVGNSIRGNVFSLDAVLVTGVLLLSDQPVGNTRQISIDANQFQNVRYAYEVRATATEINIGPSNTYTGILQAIASTVNNSATQSGIMGSGVLPLPSGQNPALYLRSRGASALAIRREDTDGALTAFFRQADIIGNISGTASAVAYNTSSDITQKIDRGELTFEEAKSIAELVTIHSFDWKSTGESDIGVFAQELFGVYPRAVTKGGWISEDGTEAHEGDEGAFYIPWSVDYSKLVPVMFRVLQGVIRGELSM